MKKLLAIITTLALMCTLFSVPAFASNIKDGVPYVVNAKETNPYNYQTIYGFQIDVTAKGPGPNYMTEVAVGSYADSTSLESSASKLYKFTTQGIVDGKYWDGNPAAVDIAIGSSGQWKYVDTAPLFTSSETHLTILDRYGANTFSIDKITWLDKDGNAISGIGSLTGKRPVTFDSKVSNPANYQDIYGFKVNATNKGTMGVYMAIAAVGSFSDVTTLQTAQPSYSWCSTSVAANAPTATALDIAAGTTGDWKYVGTTPLFTSSNSALTLAEATGYTPFNINSVVWLDKNGNELVNKYTVTINSQGGSTVKAVMDGATVKAPTTPKKAKYSFAGWYTKASGGTKITFPYTIEKNVTIYAHWTSFSKVKVTNLKAKASSKTVVKLTWSDVNGANGYIVYRSTTKAGKYVKVASVKDNSYTNKALTKGKTYYYKVIPYCAVKGVLSSAVKIKL